MFCFARLIEKESKRQSKSPTDILFDEWSTSGRRRATLGLLRDLLVRAQLFRAADYVAVNLLKGEPPQRPAAGPAARVDIQLPPDDVLQEYLDATRTSLDNRDIHVKAAVSQKNVIVNNNNSNANELSQQSNVSLSSGGSRSTLQPGNDLSLQQMNNVNNLGGDRDGMPIASDLIKFSAAVLSQASIGNVNERNHSEATLSESGNLNSLPASNISRLTDQGESQSIAVNLPVFTHLQPEQTDSTTSDQSVVNLPASNLVQSHQTENDSVFSRSGNDIVLPAFDILRVSQQSQQNSHSNVSSSQSVGNFPASAVLQMQQDDSASVNDIVLPASEIFQLGHSLTSAQSSAYLPASSLFPSKLNDSVATHVTDNEIVLPASDFLQFNSTRSTNDSISHSAVNLPASFILQHSNDDESKSNLNNQSVNIPASDLFAPFKSDLDNIPNLPTDSNSISNVLESNHSLSGTFVLPDFGQLQISTTSSREQSSNMADSLYQPQMSQLISQLNNSRLEDLLSGDSASTDSNNSD